MDRAEHEWEDDGSLIWVDAATGQAVGGRVMAGPVSVSAVPDGVLVLSANRAEVFRGVPTANNRVWTWDAPAGKELTVLGQTEQAVVLHSGDGRAIFGLDLKAGQVLWQERLRAEEEPSLDGNGNTLFLASAGKASRAVALSGEPEAVVPTGVDPTRRLRLLPWAEMFAYELQGEIRIRVRLSVLLSVLGLMIPWWVVRRGPSNWRWWLVATLWVGVLAGVVYLVGPAVLVWADGHLHTRPETLLLALAGAVAIAGYQLLGDVGQLDREQRYSWDGWYSIWMPGLFVVGLLVIGGGILRGVWWLGWRLLRGWVVRGKGASGG